MLLCIILLIEILCKYILLLFYFSILAYTKIPCHESTILSTELIYCKAYGPTKVEK